MADANRSSIRYVQEVTNGVTPANPAFQSLGYTSSSMTLNVDTESDDTIVPDRQVLDVPVLGFEVSGDISARLRFGALDDFFQASLGGTWANTPRQTFTAVATNALTVASGGAAFLTGHLVRLTGTPLNNGAVRRVASSTATSITLSSAAAETSVSGQVRVVGIEGVAADIAALASPARLTTVALNFINLGFVAGQWIKIAEGANGFATQANNTWVRIASVTATTLTLDSTPTGWAADAGTGRTIRLLMGDHVRNGLVRRSFSIEREIVRADEISTFRVFRGVEFDLSFDLAARSNIQVAFEAMGLNANNYSTTRTTGATTLAAVEGEIYNASSNIGQIRINNADFLTAITSLSIETTNNMRGREAIANTGYASLGQGRFELTGTLEAYFGDASLINAIQNNTPLSISAPMLANDKASGYHLDIPRVKFTEGGDEVSGVDSDIIPSLGFQGLKHSTLGYTFQLTRYAYLE